MHEIIIKLNLGELAFYVLPEPANRQNRLNGLTCLKNTRCLTPFQGLDKAGPSGPGSVFDIVRIDQDAEYREMRPGCQMKRNA